MTGQKVKPKLRGVSHYLAFFVALAAGGYLLAIAPDHAWFPVLIYVISLVWLLGVSALYHRPMWSLEMRARLRRLDHASIFILIAGTYTPFCLIALPPESGIPLLRAVWASGIVGAVVIAIWTRRPRGLAAIIYVAVGLIALFDIRALTQALSPRAFACFLAGGVFYITGAVVYALRRPNPNPAVFGYHEVFHVLVVIACTFHFVAVAVTVVG
ncbi:MAG: hemolysin III family protein [Clostridia bacterium]|nr:hemolysin III family protein [Deltaproteobacteria bacterium]